MPERKPYVGDTGTVIIVDCGRDITAATLRELRIEKPSGTVVNWTPELYLNNFLKYTTVVGDLNEAGVYHLQAVLTLPGWQGLGRTAEFTVFEPSS